MTTINMQTMRYINLLDRASRVKTRKCFSYNNAIFFAVPKKLVARAIGPNASNIKSLQENIGKKIKIIKEAEDVGEAQRFIEDIISPTKFKSLEVKDGMMIVTAGGVQSKAALLGRNKRRLIEMQQIIKDTFGLEFKVV
jgi:transcription antitermination factor NusA-like protein